MIQHGDILPQAEPGAEREHAIPNPGAVDFSSLTSTSGCGVFNVSFLEKDRANACCRPTEAVGVDGESSARGTVGTTGTEPDIDESTHGEVDTAKPRSGVGGVRCRRGSTDGRKLTAPGVYATSPSHPISHSTSVQVEMLAACNGGHGVVVVTTAALTGAGVEVLLRGESDPGGSLCKAQAGIVGEGKPPAALVVLVARRLLPLTCCSCSCCS